MAELGTRSYFIYADFDNTKSALKAGQFIKGNIVLTTLKHTPALTRDAIRGSDDNTYVLVLDKNLVIQKPVKILLSNKLANIVAVSGLNPDETVLLATVMSVKAGDHAKIVD